MKFEDLDVTSVERLIPKATQVAFLRQGGQKRVYTCMRDGVRYALKLIQADRPSASPGKSDEEGEEQALDTATARARREVEILSLCRSPHVVKVSADGLGEAVVEGLTVLFYFEEFVDGQDLETIIRERGPLGKDELLALATHVTLAIEALWNCDGEHRVIHRDIKPANIMRRPNGEFVLLDAGLAYDVLQESISSSGTLPGTLQYVAPERLSPGNKRSMDFRVDMFGLGVVLYEAATKRHPFAVKGITIPDLLSAIMRSSPKDVTMVQPSVPKELGALIMRLLSKRPHMRFRSTTQLLEKLDQLRGKGKT